MRTCGVKWCIYLYVELRQTFPRINLNDLNCSVTVTIDNNKLCDVIRIGAAIRIRLVHHSSFYIEHFVSAQRCWNWTKLHNMMKYWNNFAFTISQTGGEEWWHVRTTYAIILGFFFVCDSAVPRLRSIQFYQMFCEQQYTVFIFW